MGWTGNGTVALLYDWTADRDAGIPDAYISATKFDIYMEDIAGAIENTIARDGQNRPSTTINWDGNRITNLGAPTGPSDAVNANSVSLSLFGGTTTGSSSNYTVPNTYLSSVVAGTAVRMLANHTNTGAASLTISGGVLGSTAIVRADGSSALTGSEIVSGDFFEVAYDGTSWVLIHSPLEQTGDFVDGAVTVGVDDTTPGTFIAYGGANTEAGGSLRLHNPADADTSHEFWFLSSTAVNGNLDIGRVSASAVDMYIDQTGYIELSRVLGLVGIGINDTQAGTLSLYGGATGSSQGGELRLYNDDSNDGTVDYWRLDAQAGNLIVARTTGSADITVDTSGDVTFANEATTTSTHTFSAAVAGQPAQTLNPGGRLCLVSGKPDTNDTTMSATAIYYAPYVHNIISLYDGTSWYTAEFSELTNTFSDATKNPAAVPGSGDEMYDLYVWDDAGTIRLTRSPAWSTNTTRGTGSGTAERGRLDGIWTNSFDITNGPAAQRGRYVGSMYTVNGGCSHRVDTDTATATDVAIWFGYWNEHNRVTHGFYARWSAASYTYATNTYRYVRNDSNYRIVVVAGDVWRTHVVNESVNSHNLAASGGRGALNWGIDNTTQQFGQRFHNDMDVTEVQCSVCGGTLFYGAGAHGLHPLETAPSSLTFTGYTADSNLNGTHEY